MFGEGNEKKIIFFDFLFFLDDTYAKREFVSVSLIFLHLHMWIK